MDVPPGVGTEDIDPVLLGNLGQSHSAHLRPGVDERVVSAKKDALGTDFVDEEFNLPGRAHREGDVEVDIGHGLGEFDGVDTPVRSTRVTHDPPYFRMSTGDSSEEVLVTIRVVVKPRVDKDKKPSGGSKIVDFVHPAVVEPALAISRMDLDHDHVRPGERSFQFVQGEFRVIPVHAAGAVQPVREGIQSLEHHCVSKGNIGVETHGGGNDGLVDPANVHISDDVAGFTCRYMHVEIRAQVGVEVDDLDIIEGKSAVDPVKIFAHDQPTFRSRWRFRAAIASLSGRGISA